MSATTVNVGNYWSTATPPVWTAGDKSIIQVTRDAGVVCTTIACVNAGTTTADTVTLSITPTRPGTKLFVIIDCIGFEIKVDVTAGDYWFAKAMTQATVAADTSQVFAFTPARYQTKATSKILVVLTPLNTKALSNTASYQVYEMPDVDLNVVKAT